MSFSSTLFWLCSLNNEKEDFQDGHYEKKFFNELLLMFTSCLHIAYFHNKKLKVIFSAGCSPVKLNLSIKVHGDSLVEAFWILFVALVC